MQNSILAAGFLFAATAISFIVMPLGFGHRNPPFHKWGGLDVPAWTTAFSIELAAAALCLVFRVFNLANRWVCYGLLCVNIILLAALINELLQSMARGTI